MLTGLGRSGDTDDLAWTTLDDQEIPNANMVAGDGDRVGPYATLDDSNALADSLTNTGGTTVLTVDDNLLMFMTMMRMERMQNAVGDSPDSVTDGVVVTFVVVVTHFGLAAVRWIDCGLSFDSNVPRFGDTTFVFEVVSWLRASTVVALGNVDDGFVCFVLMARWDFDIDLGTSEALVGLLVANVAGEMSVTKQKDLRGRLLGQQN